MNTRTSVLNKPKREHPAASASDETPAQGSPRAAAPKRRDGAADKAVSPTPGENAETGEIRMSVDVRRDQKKRLKMLALNTDLSLKDHAQRAFDEYLAKHNA